jgi:hypothetical protein
MSLKDQLKNSYLDWLRENISANDLSNGAVEFTSPLMDRHNDHLQIYAMQKNGKIILTDDAYIIDDLIMNGYDIDSTRRRKEIFYSIINGLGVKRSESNELYVEATLENFPQKKHMLLQAMLSVNDMFVLNSSTIQTVFLEDVENFLINSDIRYSQQISFIGRSGLPHTFEFLIPSSRNAPERLIKTINLPNQDQAKITLFSWNEIKDDRKSGTQLYTFLNDSNKRVKPDVLDAFSQYEIKPILWSKRKDYIKELSA